VDCDFEVFLHLGPPVKLDLQLDIMKVCYAEQLRLCQFINSVLVHYADFGWVNAYLREFVERHLSSLTEAFGWHEDPGLNELRELYCLPGGSLIFGSDDYYWLNNCLKESIKMLEIEFEPLAQVMLEMLLRYQQVIEAFLFEPAAELLSRINGLELRADFSQLHSNQEYIGKTLGGLDFYEL
jgi:hypothetical protein